MLTVKLTLLWNYM